MWHSSPSTGVQYRVWHIAGDQESRDGIPDYYLFSLDYVPLPSGVMVLVLTSIITLTALSYRDPFTCWLVA